MLTNSRIFVSTALISSVMISGLATPTSAFAATVHETKHIVATTYTPSYHDEQALITNLKMANKMLEAAIKHGQLSVAIYSNFTKRLEAIMIRLDSGRAFHLISDLKSVVTSSATLLTQSVSALSTNDQNAINALNQAIPMSNTVQEQVSSLAVTPAGKGYHFGPVEIIVDGKPVVMHAQKLLDNNMTYINLTDAEQLIKNLTGDSVGKMTLNQKTGQYNKAQQWNSKTKVWDIAWEHTLPAELSGTKGNATLEIIGSPIVHTNVVAIHEKASWQVFVPLWTVQQVIDQMIYVTSKNDVFNGAKWTIDFNRNQHYNTSNVGVGHNSNSNNPNNQSSVANAPGGGGWANS